MKFLNLLLLLAPLAVSSQIIPNANFENWTIEGEVYNADDWSSDNSANFQIVSRDEDPYEGNYALKLTAQAIGVGDYGEVSTSFPVVSIAPTLDFFVRTTCEFGYVSVELTYFNNDFEIIQFTWFSTESFEEWTAVTMELDQIEPIFTHAEIKIIAAVGDLIAGTAEISVDAMGFDQALSSHSEEPNSISLYPNPSSEILNIKSDQSPIRAVSFYSLDGKSVRTRTGLFDYLNLDVSDLDPGVYIVRVETATGVVQRKKVLINR